MNKTLFDDSKATNRLAEKMRASDIIDFVGQKHILSDNSQLKKAIINDNLTSCIFYGPPGVGKTTLANIIEKNTRHDFYKLSAVLSGVSDAKAVIAKAVSNRAIGIKTILFLDECHRWSKTQSDSVLEHVEKGDIIFIGSTTENPYISLTKALLSRCSIYEFKKIDIDDIVAYLNKTIKDRKNGLGNYDIEISADAITYIAEISNGDLRTALNILESCILYVPYDKSGKQIIQKRDIEHVSQKRDYSISKDQFYDVLSAYCKSLRGSDSNAAIYYARLLIEAGIDPLILFRRLIVHSSEDVGMADPNALVVATSAMTAFKSIGLPEGLIPMINAIIYVCEAPKSNSVIKAKYKVDDIVKNRPDYNVPSYLRDRSYVLDKENLGEYKYPHDYENGIVDQQYLPDSLKDEEIYQPSNIGFESKIKKKG